MVHNELRIYIQTKINIYLNVFCIFFHFGFERNFVWHFYSTKSVSRYCISYCDQMWKIYKWEKFHWIWHHIIHPARQVTLMWNIFFSLLQLLSASRSHRAQMYAIYQYIASGWLILVARHQMRFLREFGYIFITKKIKWKWCLNTLLKFFSEIDNGWIIEPKIIPL